MTFVEKLSFWAVCIGIALVCPFLLTGFGWVFGAWLERLGVPGSILFCVMMTAVLSPLPVLGVVYLASGVYNSRLDKDGDPVEVSE